MADPKDASAGNGEHGSAGENFDVGNGVAGTDSAASINGIPVTDAGSIGSGSDTGSESGKRGRGRPRKSGSGTAAPKTEGKKVPPSVSGIETILLSAHAMIASFTGIPEIEIGKDESKLLAVAVAEVAKHYDIAPDPKIVAWVGLFGALGAVYGPRIAAYGMRKSMEPKTGPENKSTGSLVNFPSFGPAGAVQ